MSLRKKLVKLAHDNPQLRKDILPLLRTKRAGIVIPEGTTWESESGLYRLHRFRDAIKFWDLTYAGKRGKNVSQFTVYGLERPLRDKGEMNLKAKEAMFNFLARLTKFKNYTEAYMAAEMMISLMEKEGAGWFTPKIESRTEKGVDVAPAGFSPVKIVTDQISLDADYDSFYIRDNTDVYNLQTCIPAIRGGKKDIKVFYRWVRDNQSRIKNMKYQDIVKAMNDLGLQYHTYCAMD